MAGINWGGLASIVVSTALVGCGNGPSEGSVSGTEGATDGTSMGSTSQPSADTSTSGESDSVSPTTSGGSQTSQSGTTDETSSASQTATSTPGETTEGSATDDTTAGVSVGESSTSVGESTDGTTTSAESSTTGADETTGEPCVPSEEVCDDLDNDCDGQVDDVDVGKDGICDCLNIALFGKEGANPSAEFQAWLEAQGTQVDRIQTTVNEPVDKATLNKYDIVILDWLQRTYTAEEAATMQTWVEAGGGLMAMTGHTNNNTVVERPNSLTQPMGLSYNASKGFFSGPITQFVPHPITMGLTSISFYGGLYVDIADDGVGVNQTIMTLPQGPVGVVQDRKDGRLFLFGDEWIEFDSEWKNIPQIKQFWVQTLAYLGPKESCQVPQ